MKETVKVSIVVPVYNCENYLEACIQSILEQTYKNFELLLIDDGSSDGSGKICDAFENHEKVSVYHKKNEGVSRARNEGISRSTGDCIMFVDSDDTIVGPNSLASRTPCHFCTGCGAFQRRFPTGGAANGIPLNTVMPERSFPSRIPLAVVT